MLKKARLYSLLFTIVASTIVSLFSLSPAAQAQADTASWDGENIIYDVGDYDDGEPFTRGNCTGDDQSPVEGVDLLYSKCQDLQGGPDQTLVHVIYIEGDPTQTTDAVYAQFLYTGNDNVTGAGNPYDERESKDIRFDALKAEPVADSTGDGSGEGAVESNCKVDGIGWLVCPILRFLAQVTDKSYSILEGTLLRVEPLPLTENTGNSGGDNLFSVWKKMRDFANIAFIIGFLVIVFSQLTNLGIGNYGIKRLLPKIIIAAILVNISYYICAIAVDASNILGSTLRGAFVSLEFRTASGDGGGVEAYINGTKSSEFVSLVDTVLAGAAVYVLLPVLLPMLVGVVVAVITVVVTLAMRQALIILLIAISPLAFVALLLPNTEDYFKRWRSLFTTMLLVYPAISLIFGASALASNIIMASADDSNTLVQIVGAGVAIIPLFITPIIMKVSGGVLNRFAGIVNDPSKGWIDGKRKALEDQGKLMKTGRAERTARWVGGTSGSGIFGGANSWRRRAASLGTTYGANTRERARKDKLDAAEKDMESMYLNSPKGQNTRAEASNAQINLQNAQLNVETARIMSAQGVSLQEEQITAEAQKQTAEDNTKGTALNNLAASGTGPVIWSGAEDAKNRRVAAESNAASIGYAGADRATAARAEESDLIKQGRESNLKAQSAPLVSSAARTFAATAEQEKTTEENITKARTTDSLSDTTLAAVRASEIGMRTAENNATARAEPLVSQTTRTAEALSELGKNTAVNNAAADTSEAVNSSLPGRAALGQNKDSELRKTIGENDSKSIGLARADEEFKIQAETSAEELSTVQNQDKRLYEEIAARGTTDLGTFDPAAHGVSHATADAARSSRLTSNATNSAVSTAQNEGSTEYARAVQDSAAAAAGTPGAELIERASGNINPEAGRERAVGRATAIINKNTIEALDNELDTMSEATPTGPWTDSRGGTHPGLDAIMADTSLSVERRAAAALKRIEIGGDEDVRDSFEYLGTTPMDDDVAAIQQLVISRAKRIPKVVSQSQQAAAKRGAFRVEQYDTATRSYIPGSTGTMDDLARNRVLTNSMSPETMASMPEEDLQHMFRAINGSPLVGTPELRTLQNDILEYLTNPENAGSLPARKITNQMEAIMHIT